MASGIGKTVQLKRKHIHPGLLSILTLALLRSSLPGKTAQEVRIEKKAVSIPAGRGQKPFDVTRHLIPLSEIQSGGPWRDGIPALNYPAFVSSSEADHYLRSFDAVLGIAAKGEAKAYPVRILNWHEVVNDKVAGEDVLISWCPLCGSGIAYDPQVGGQLLTFGVSGLLYKDNLLLYDHETDSLWSQLGRKAITGSLAGTSLSILPATLTTWTQWREEHPLTKVLSFHTGYERNYSADPYVDRPLDRRQALVVLFSEKAKIYPYAELKKAGAPVKDVLGGHEFTIVFDVHNQTAEVTTATAEEALPHFVAFFADARAFYPKAQIFKSK